MSRMTENEKVLDSLKMNPNQNEWELTTDVNTAKCMLLADISKSLAILADKVEEERRNRDGASAFMNDKRYGNGQ